MTDDYFTITVPTVGAALEDLEVRRLLQNFCQQFAADMVMARMSGAADPNDFTDVEIGRAVLVITAEKFAPISKENKAMLENLRHFV